MSAVKGYQYVALRCVPRVEREEFVNVGVVLFCDDADFLGLGLRSSTRTACGRSTPALDLAAVRAALAAVERVCRGEAHVDFGVGTRATAYGSREAVDDASARFGFLKAAAQHRRTTRAGARRPHRRPRRRAPAAAARSGGVILAAQTPVAHTAW